MKICFKIGFSWRERPISMQTGFERLGGVSPRGWEVEEEEEEEEEEEDEKEFTVWGQ